MRNVMLDLETMGAGPNAAIVSIGAVAFDPDTCKLGPSFYRTVDLASSVAVGGIIDPETVMWWLSQSQEARGALQGPNTHISQALADFWSFVSDLKRSSSDGADVRVWGNGAAFDNVVLRTAYQRAGLSLPWPFWNDRCYRTVKAMNPEIQLVRVGEHHNALMDAVTQAAHLLEILTGRRPDVSAFVTPTVTVTPEG